MVALAVHPARLPWHGVDELLQRLPHYFDDPHVVALASWASTGRRAGGGDLLPATGAGRTAAQTGDRPHADREKPARTRRMLALLKDSPLDPSRVLVDHVSPETFALARGMGCWCGLTLQPGLFEAESAAGLISRHGAERIVLTSDIGEGATDLLALPKADEALKAAGLTAGLRRRVLWEGPLGFLKS